MKTTAPSTDPGVYRELVGRMLSEARDEVVRADGKASILLALYVGLEALLVGTLMQGSWGVTLDGWWQTLFWIGCASTIAAILSVGFAVYPRTSNRHDSCVTYHGHVAVCATLGEMQEGLRRAASMNPSRDEEQLWTVSRIVKRKYKAIALSMWLFLFGSAGVLAAVMLGC